MQNDAVTNTNLVLNALSDISAHADSQLLRGYVEQLIRWNPSIGLISKRDPAHTAGKLIRLSIKLWDFAKKELNLSGLPAPLKIADIGSGGGFPGLVWKLLNEDISIDLVERSEKKYAFLDRTIKTLALNDARAIFADGQDLAMQPYHRGKYQIVTMLAVSTPEKMAPMIEALLACPGYFVTIRGTEERIIKDTIGQSLHIHKAVSSDDGLQVIYEKSSS
jgi:16S rRNA (guanine527-N7)-methyltransferase